MAINFSNISKHIDDCCRIKGMNWERMEGGPLDKWFKRENLEAFLWPSLIAAAFWTVFFTLKPRYRYLGRPAHFRFCSSSSTASAKPLGRI